MKRQMHLLVIDPQNDFCDLPQDYLPRSADGVPALPVPGAHADMLRVAAIIDQGGAGLTGISVTIDSHHRIDIAHPAFWKSADQQAVPPFTQITLADVTQGRYLPRDPASVARAVRYLEQLEAARRYTLMVWPTHCEMGSWGHNVHADVRAAYNRWEERTLCTVAKVVKGTNPWTEHYSAIQAEVPDEDDPATQMNAAVIAMLARCERVYITGEAGSHCVKATTEHIVDNWDPQQIAKLVLVTDCMSPVTGFEAQYERFISAMRERGVQIAHSGDVIAELTANAQL
jgi:nicotinamidase/pyrazinamidase